MQVDFYQLSRDPLERVVVLLADKIMEAGGRVLVVSDDPERRTILADALWAREDRFLANGSAGERHAERQPILISANCHAANGATMAILADGKWCDEASSFEQAILLFGPDQTEPARALWGRLSGGTDALRIFKQGEGGGWREGR